MNELAPFWRDLVRLLEIYGYIRRDERDKIPKVRRAMANPVYKEYITRREPPRQTVSRSGQPSLPFTELPAGENDANDP